MLYPDILAPGLREKYFSQLEPSYQVGLVLLYLAGLAFLIYKDYPMTFFRKKKSWKQQEMDNSSSALDWKRLEKAKTCIRESRLDLAFDLLEKIPLAQSSAALSIHMGTYHKNERDFNLTQITEDQHRVNLSKLIKALVAFIDELEEQIHENQAQFQKIKTQLKKRYQKRLDQKLSKRKAIPLQLSRSAIGANYFPYAHFEPHPNKSQILQAFQAANGQLLLLGTAGASKTTLLLELALRLLEQKTEAIPLLINLSTWRASYERLEHWLAEVLAAEMGYNQSTGSRVLQSFPLIFLFDGFDEIPDGDQPSLLEAISYRNADVPQRYVLSSRIHTYQPFADRLSINLAVEVNTLDAAQVKMGLAQIEGQDQGSAALLHQLEKDKSLYQIISTPFYFNTLQSLFARGLSLQKIALTDQPPAIQAQILLRTFIETELKNNPNKSYRPEQAQDWLHFLALQMTQRDLIRFELTDLQFDWQPNKRLGYALVSLINTFNIGFIYALWAGLFVSVIVAVTRWPNVVDPIFEVMAFVFLVVLGGFLIFSLFLGFIDFLGALYLIYWKKKPLAPQKIITKEQWYFSKAILWKSLENSLYPFIFLFVMLIPFLSIQVVLLVAGLFALYSILVDLSQKGHRPFLQINYPYQRFWASLRSLDFAIVQHFLLRIQLWWSGALPLRLRYFLDDMVQCHILEREGASWRFRHDFLLRYFYSRDGWSEPSALSK